MGRLRDFLMGTPSPAPPERSGPYASEDEARAAGRALTARHLQHLLAYEGYMEAIEDDGRWYVLARRDRDRPRWQVPDMGGGPGPA